MMKTVIIEEILPPTLRRQEDKSRIHQIWVQILYAPLVCSCMVDYGMLTMVDLLFGSAHGLGEDLALQE